MRKIIALLVVVTSWLYSFGQVYKAPTDEKVAAKLSQWGDKKFGLFMHWGIYSIPGIVESWSINS
ncbi:MAG: alpha-L-fucosidase, partial [Acinetobacter sp.]